MNEIDKFIGDQLSVWPEAAANYRSLKAASTRELEVNGLTVTIQHNPGRVRSSAAAVDKESIAARECFLCTGNRPAEQMMFPFEGRKGRRYNITINPYPIFPNHLVIALDHHEDQSIWHKYGDIADLAHHYTAFTFFYNGPRCGASAPDHMHFQAAPRGSMPLERDADRLLDLIAVSGSGVPDGEEKSLIPEEIKDDITFISSVQEAQLYHYNHFAKGIFVLRSRTSKSMAKLFYRLLDCAPVLDGESEPMFNMLTWYHPVGTVGERKRRPAGNTHGLAAFEYRAVVILRSAHRSHHYFSDGPDHLTMSPGCADVAGMFVTPEESDFKKLDSRMLGDIMDEVTLDEATEKTVLWRLTRTQPVIHVGIMSGQEIEFEIISDGAGPQKVSYQEGKISYNGALYDELLFEGTTKSTIFAEPDFILYGVTIGVDFHWQRKVTQQFAGSLKFIVENGKVTAVNIVGVEDYLLSVISSEMKSSATLEYLKAHSVISRSWVMSQILHRKNSSKEVDERKLAESNSVASLVTHLDSELNPASLEGDGPAVKEYTKWFDHDDHKKFDVCADDHCQRYQGLTMAVGDNVRKAIDFTWGLVLTSEGEICDCRFYKSCGGWMERFSTCWEDKDYPYLQALPDTEGHDPAGKPFCDTTDEKVLVQVLNDYDLETKDFFKWKVEYSREYLSELVRSRSGIDFGTIRELIPLSRGGSGRIYRMEIVGDKERMIIGKELIIRRWLSESHLKSSAFEVSWTDDDHVVLEGHGWGHGVGFCQIGAAVMAYKGYKYDQILAHYYPGSKLERR